MFAQPHPLATAGYTTGIVGYDTQLQNVTILQIYGGGNSAYVGNELNFGSSTGVQFSHSTYDPDAITTTLLEIDLPQDLQTTASVTFNSLKLQTNGKYTNVQRPTTGDSYNLTIPESSPPSSNMVLMFDSTGEASWAANSSLSSLSLADTILSTNNGVSVDLKNLTVLY